MSAAAALPQSLLDNPRLDQWLAFAEPNRVTLMSGKVELGQGILTALAQIAAEELDVPVSSIDVVSGETLLSPNEGFTAGSLSVQVGGGAIRLAAADARHRLLTAAAGRLDAAVDALSVDEGRILRDALPTNLDYWHLAPLVDWSLPVSGTARAKAEGEYRVVGQSVARLDLGAKFGTAAAFIHDIRLPGLLHARVLHQPFRGAVFGGLDEERLARRHAGVRLLRRASFAALVAEDEHAAAAAEADLGGAVVWTEPPGGWRPPAVGPEKRLGVEEAPAAEGSTPFSATYSRPLTAHASIGPSCALAREAAGTLEVWTHSQGVFALSLAIGRVLARPVESVVLRHAPGAGCYGHNGADDAALEAAILATMVGDRPVRVQWSRADEFSAGPLGASGRATVEAALDPDGRIGRWHLSVESLPQACRPGSFGSVNLSAAEALDPASRPATIDDLPEAAGGGASRNALAIYDIRPSARVRLVASAIRTSSLRSLGAPLNVFAIESAMDELALLSGSDPLEFRLRHLSDPRARAVLEAAARLSGWGIEHVADAQGRGIGLARYKGKGAWCAAVAELSVDEAVKVGRLWLAADIGLVINPDGALNQLEGGALQAMSWALKEAVPSREDGHVPPLDWENYPILRFSEVPEIRTELVEAPGRPPLGAGEAAQGPVIAAIGNALANALGIRVRSLPFTRDRILASIEGVD